MAFYGSVAYLLSLLMFCHTVYFNQCFALNDARLRLRMPYV